MIEILGKIQDLITILNNKYGFEIEAEEFTPNINFKIQGIPKEKGIAKGQVNSPTSTIWYDGMWVSSDYINSTGKPPLTITKDKPLSDQDVKVILDNLERIKGTIKFDNLDQIKKSYLHFLEMSPQNIVEKDSEGKRFTLKEKDEDFKKRKDSVKKEIINYWAKIQEKNKEAVESREAVLKTISNTLGKEIGQKIKLVVLTTKTSEEAKEVVEKASKKVIEKEKKEEEKKDIPKFESLSKEVIKYILDIFKSNSKASLSSILDTLRKDFNKKIIEEKLSDKDKKEREQKFNGLINELVAGSKKVNKGEVNREGVMNYLSDYETHKKEISEVHPALKSTQVHAIIDDAARKIIKYLDKVDTAYHETYSKDTFHKFTHKVISSLQKYMRGQEKDVALEHKYLELIHGGDKYPGLIGGWRKLDVPLIVKSLDDIKESMRNMVRRKTLTKKEIDEKVKDDSEVGKMIEKPFILDVVTDIYDKDLTKNMKKDHKEEIAKIRDMGLTPDQIKDRNKKFKEHMEDKTKKEPKKSYEVVVDYYTPSIFSKLEKLANLTNDVIVKAELMDIAKVLKDLI